VKYPGTSPLLGYAYPVNNPLALQVESEAPAEPTRGPEQKVF